MMEIDFQQIAHDIRNGRCQYLGAGAGRRVYDLGNGCVVKMAKNIFGLAQNRTEYEVASIDKTALFARVLNASDRFKFLIMEKAEKIQDISHVWRFFNVGNNRELYRVKELQDISARYNLGLLDFGQASSWGQVGGRPVIIDYGFRNILGRARFPALRAGWMRPAGLNTESID